MLLAENQHDDQREQAHSSELLYRVDVTDATIHSFS